VCPFKLYSITWGGGDNLDVFLDDFPTVSREQAEAVLGLANELLLAQFE
jgi:uncharacterized protein (DUF433 family)